MTTLQTASSVSVNDQDTGLKANVITRPDAINALAVDATVVITSGSPQYYLSNNKMFSVSTDLSMASAGTDNPLILIKNPSDSGKIIYFVKIQAGISVSNVAARFILYANPTITSNGTVITNRQRNVGNSPTSGSALTYTSPILSALGNKISSSECGQNSNSVTFAEDFSLSLQPGNNLLLTGDPLSNNRNSVLTLIWVEETI